jgi:dTDP-4-amino-4,6-dideoxygalactose transaminase
MSVTDAVRHGSKQVIFEDYDELGYNYRMTDLQAAVGREQLRRLPELVAQRRRLAEQYCERLSTIAGLSLPAEPRWARSNWQSFCVRLSDDIDQRAVMQALLDQGISTRRGVMNIHLEGAYSGQSSHRAATSLTRSVSAQQQTVILPLYAQMTEQDIVRVVETLRQALAETRTRGGVRQTEQDVIPA